MKETKLTIEDLNNLMQALDGYLDECGVFLHHEYHQQLDRLKFKLSMMIAEELYAKGK